MLDWDGDNDLDDQSFLDGPHFEIRPLPEKVKELSLLAVLLLPPDKAPEPITRITILKELF